MPSLLSLSEPPFPVLLRALFTKPFKAKNKDFCYPFYFSRCSDKCKGWPAFVTSILFIGLLTAVIGDVAAHFGCISQIKDSVTAITIVALGTSVPGLKLTPCF